MRQSRKGRGKFESQILTEDLLKARKLLSDRGGEVVTRRLTELEYINTLRVLTGVTVPESLVPDDESGTDFNTLGRYQTFSPAMLEVTRRILRMTNPVVLLLQGRRWRNADCLCTLCNSNELLGFVE